MSKSKNFMIKAEAIARDALTKIQKADADLRSAEQRRNKNRAPLTGRIDAVKAALAEADFLEAKAAYEKCCRELPGATPISFDSFAA